MVFKQCSFGAKNGPRKYFPPNYTKTTSMTSGSMLSCFLLPYHLNVAAEIEAHQTRNCCSIFFFVQFCWAQVICSLSILFLGDKKQHLMCSSRAVSPTASRFETLFYIPWSAYLECSFEQPFLPMSSEQSDHSHLTSGINKAFSSKRTDTHRTFSPSQAILCKS